MRAHRGLSKARSCKETGAEWLSHAARLSVACLAGALVAAAPTAAANMALANAPAPRMIAAPGKVPQAFGAFPMAKAAAGSPGVRSASASSADYVAGEVLVRFATPGGLSAASHSAAIDAAGGEFSRPVKGAPGLELVTLKKGVSVEQAVASYSGQPGVAYAQPNYILRSSVVDLPNDPRFPTMWALRNTGQANLDGSESGTPGADISAPAAWSVTTGSKDVVVAVVDTGVDYNHPDLHNNMWVNQAEAGGAPGLDDDGNGYIDDIYGIDAYNGDSDPADDAGHGTHCAGTIGAVGNNGLGVTGINWNVSIMAVKDAGSNGVGTDAAAIEAIDYATQMGADIISCSWGGGGYEGDALWEAMARSRALFVCAAGNAGVDIDQMPVYPAAYKLDNIIAVAATDNRDRLADFSDYSAASVDLAAPGVDVTSTVPAIYTWAPVSSDAFGSLAAWDTSEYSAHPWTASSARYTSGPSSAANSWYGNNAFDWLFSSTPVDLSGGAPAYRMRFKYWLDLEPGSDDLYVLASTDNVEFVPIASATGNSEGWHEAELNLTDFAGNDTVYLAFVLLSDDQNSRAYEGAYIDDLTIEKAVSSSYTEAYDSYSGTSMATPHVTGVAALVKAANPDRTTSQLKASILGNVDPLPGLAGKVKTGGRLNAFKALTGSVVVPSAITIKSNVGTTYIGKVATLSGAVSPVDLIGTNIVVYVMKPGKTYWTYSSNRTAYALGFGGAWQYKYTFKRGMTKGLYRFRAVVPPRAGFLTSTSSTLSVRLK